MAQSLTASRSPYVDFRMQEWGMGEQSRRMQISVRRVLSELEATALVCLKDPRFEVMVRPDPGFVVWAHFPIYSRRLIAKKLKPRVGTRVLVMSVAAFESSARKFFEDCLRDSIGHVLLYLRKPSTRTNNDCTAAMKEWRACLRPEAKAAKKAAAAGRRS